MANPLYCEWQTQNSKSQDELNRKYPKIRFFRANWSSGLMRNVWFLERPPKILAERSLSNPSLDELYRFHSEEKLRVRP